MNKIVTLVAVALLCAASSQAMAQCASCSGGASPVFSQGYATSYNAPTYNAVQSYNSVPISYAQPQMSYAQPQMSYAQPQTACCGQSAISYAQPQTACCGQSSISYAQPQMTYSQPQMGCCGQSTMSYRRPIFNQRMQGYSAATNYGTPVYSGAVSSGCSNCGGMVQPVFGGNMSNGGMMGTTVVNGGTANGGTPVQGQPVAGTSENVVEGETVPTPDTTDATDLVPTVDESTPPPTPTPTPTPTPENDGA